MPEVLRSGNHAAIARWRRDRALERTAARRPDLLAALPADALDAADRAFLAAGLPRRVICRARRVWHYGRVASPDGPVGRHPPWERCPCTTAYRGRIFAMNTLDALDAQMLRSDIPAFRPGDTLKVHVKVIEGSRSRIQVFQGVVIRRHGAGARETFTVRKMSFGVGVERTFPVHSPNLDRIEVVHPRRRPPREAVLPA